ncbi:glycosyltransferase [Phenylobacterium sp.]|uniref:glycosyltransferase n=1 Tax=Phenylobacterium sp. TaxID=1871053 RepID=UPI002FC5B709
MRIGWCIPKLRLDIASVRHRVIYPALALGRLGHVNEMFESADEAMESLGRLDALVIVKRLDAGMVSLLAAADDAAVPVVLDLCDDILELDYRPRLKTLHRSVFAAMEPRLAAITTTGPYLARRLQAYGTSGHAPFVIPDCAESRKIYAAAQTFVRKQDARRREAEGAEATGSAGANMAPAAPGAGSLLRRAVRAIGRPVHSAKVAHAIWREYRYAAESAKKVSRARAASSSADPSGVKGPTVVWFGNHGGPHSDFGMLTLLSIAAELRRAYQEHPYTLVVVSNSERKYKAFLRHLGVPTQYVEWTQERTYDLLDSASAFVMPAGDDPFSRSKSANRALMALSCGVPVVAEAIESLDDFKDCVEVGELGAGLARYLKDPAARRAHVLKARGVIARKYSIEALGAQWEQLLGDVCADAGPSRELLASDSRRILFLIDLVQDLDLILPLIDEARRAGVYAAVTVSERAARTSPRVVEALIERRISPTMITGRDVPNLDARWLRGAEALITASETSAGPQKIARGLTELANAAGVRTYTLQHGLENLGLTYRDPAYPDLTIASQSIFTWGPPDRLPEWVAPEILVRTVGVGRVQSRRTPHRAQLPSLFDGRPVIGVFENLHWDRYSNGFRQRFLADLAAAARARPSMVFLVRPHPAGQWLAKNPAALPDRPENLLMAEPWDPQWEPWHAPALAPHLAGVITTPSTVALDAAEANRPVAVAGYDVAELSAYEPLPILEKLTDWLAFCDDCAKSAPDLSAGEIFTRRVCLEGDAAHRIVLEVLHAGRPELRAVADDLAGGTGELAVARPAAVAHRVEADAAMIQPEPRSVTSSPPFGA